MGNRTEIMLRMMIIMVCRKFLVCLLLGKDRFVTCAIQTIDYDWSLFSLSACCVTQEILGARSA